MHPLLDQLHSELETLKETGLYKAERYITTPQGAEIGILPDQEVLNFCANNYLGLSDHPDLVAAAKEGVDRFGFGLSSVRFICGTQTLHKELESAVSNFLQKEDTILYPSCFDANGGLFETILGPEDAIISDALNHASIIDGIRLCKAKRFRYKNNDMMDLRAKLEEAKAAGARHIMIATDGVFSMDGVIADLASICELADEFNALVMVDDCHATGFMGEKGRGAAEYCGVLDRVDIITSTLGKALGGASGGFTASHRVIVDWLRNRSRPYLFSNTLAPMIAAASVEVFRLLKGEWGASLRQRLHENAAYFRKQMSALGFDLVPGSHPIIPVMLGDAALASTMADQLLTKGIYVIGFSYPVVPMHQARIRVQMSAAHTQAQIDHAIQGFAEVGRDLGVIK